VQILVENVFVPKELSERSEQNEVSRINELIPASLTTLYGLIWESFH
jgi:hypothetical protein